MKTQTSNTIAYAQNLLSFVFQNKKAGDNIKAVYLFGSAMRGELNKGSDIDLFAECNKNDELDVQRLLDSGIVKFTSSTDYQKWKLMHFTYPFSIQVGRLKEWDLQLSIASEGVLLYGKSILPELGSRSVIFSIHYPKKKRDYMRLRRLLFGRDEKEYSAAGEIRRLQGKKLCTHSFLVPKEEQGRCIDLLSKEKIDFFMKEVTLLES
ncbi:nucleotidyltransferase domain-containing protein [Candidatus Woesearchaeota archaeon]|nr:nucleotidyltransferase domain-containing protein [Candidatus Woesearchaeota archaeon]